MAKGKKQDTKKVGGKSGKGDGKKEKPKKEKKVVFSKKAPKDGWTEAMPEGFSFNANHPLKKKDFANAGTYMKHQAETLRFKAAAMTKKADLLAKKAERVEKMGDDQTAKKVKRAERLGKQYAELRKQLEAAGVDLDAISLESDDDNDGEGDKTEE